MLRVLGAWLATGRRQSTPVVEESRTANGLLDTTFSGDGKGPSAEARSAAPRPCSYSRTTSSVSRILMTIGWLQGNCHHLEQVIAADRLAMRNGYLIEGGKRVTGQAGHGAEDESLAAIAVRADEVNDASHVSCALAADDLKRRPGRVCELGVQIAGHAGLTSSRTSAASTSRKNAKYTTSLVISRVNLAGDLFPAAIQP